MSRPLQQLKWIAVLPAVVGAAFGFFAAMWTEWPQALAAVVLLVIAAGLWRVFSGVWPLVAPERS